jgi:hypothetical protein
MRIKRIVWMFRLQSRAVGWTYWTFKHSFSGWLPAFSFVVHVKKARSKPYTPQTSSLRGELLTSTAMFSENQDMPVYNWDTTGTLAVFRLGYSKLQMYEYDPGSAKAAVLVGEASTGGFYRDVKVTPAGTVLATSPAGILEYSSSGTLMRTIDTGRFQAQTIALCDDLILVSCMCKLVNRSMELRTLGLVIPGESVCHDTWGICDDDTRYPIYCFSYATGCFVRKLKAPKVIDAITRMCVTADKQFVICGLYARVYRFPISGKGPVVQLHCAVLDQLCGLSPRDEILIVHHMKRQGSKRRKDRLIAHAPDGRILSEFKDYLVGTKPRHMANDGRLVENTMHVRSTDAFGNVIICVFT